MKYTMILMMFFAMVGCKAEIGDECGYDVDCSQNMDRTCDGGQPGGYCLIISCDPNSCPGEATCIEFTTPCPTDENGEETDNCAQIEPNRGRPYCLKHCKSDSDCRSKYTCATPEELDAQIIDSSPKGNGVCVPKLPEVTEDTDAK